MDICEIKDWFDDFSPGPLFIAGPCSVESRSQVMDIATTLKQSCAPSLFRGGIWKPRTRPGTFSGVGLRGLKWLKEVKKETGIRVVVEVANPVHLEACLKEDIDVVWIGARTVSNPFSVQEISEALKGVDIPVLVKNPLNPDVDLWLGAIERINNAGIKRMAAVHRGFAPFERTRYRNMPKWEIPIELRRREKKLPVICDPSHMAGNSDLVPELSQKAMDLNMDGLMIEVHNNPPSALSDNKQQLSPGSYCSMMNNLVIRKSSPDDSGFTNQLDELRNQIDSVDNQLIELLARRMEVIDMISDYKFNNNIAVLQMERWLEILDTRLDQAELSGLDKDFTERYLKLLHQESIRKQTLKMKDLKKEANGSGDNSPDE